MPIPTRAPRPTTRRLSLLTVALLLTSLVPAATAAAAAAEEVSPAAADEVLVRYRADVTAAQRARVARDHGLSPVSTSPDGRTQVVVAEGRSPATARRELKDDPRVLAVADNHRREPSDDVIAEPGFSELWGLHNTGQTITGATTQKGTADVDIDGIEALRITKGKSSVVVAVIDDGVDFSHPDLVDRRWTNPGESGAKATNGIDDDGNGYIDDVHGWDFCNNDNTLFDDEPLEGHGTHVAGTIAASHNGTGVVGVAPGIKIMGLKFISNSPACDLNDDEAVLAIDYAKSFGVRIINASWGGPFPSDVLDAAIGESGALFVVAAGNERSNMDGGGPKSYPAVSTKPNVLTVAAIDQTGKLASFSNYGTRSVDLSAPGTNILSTFPGGYAWAAGTSMAAPHVSGVAALVVSAVSTALSPTALRARLLTSAVPLAPTVGKTATGRLVNALRALDRSGPVAKPVDRHGVNVGSTLGTSTVSTTMTWPAATDDRTGIRDYIVKRSLKGGPWTTAIASTTSRSLKANLTFGVATRYRVFARDGAGNHSVGAVGPSVTAALLQDGTSLARYGGSWSTVTSSSASNGRFHRSTQAGAWVEFRTTARAIAVVGRKGPDNGKAKVYVDGAYHSTIDLQRSSLQSKVVVFNASWTTAGVHTVRLVVAGTSGRPRVEVDAFAILR